MRKFLFKLLWGSAFLVTALVAWFGTATAQSDLQILYSPMVIELAGERGATVPFEITILNNAQFSTAHFRTQVAGLAETPDGVYVPRKDEWAYDASSWIEIDQPEFSIAPGQFHIIRGRIQIPRRATASGYATVIAELLPEPTPEGVAASTEYYQQFSTALEITVGRQHRRSAYISELRVIPTSSAPELSLVYGPNGLLFMASVKNDGDIHVRGRGQLIIRDALGRRVRTVPLGSGRGVIIPEATLDFGSVLAGLLPGTYEVEARIEYGGHRPAVARTTLNIEDGARGLSQLGGRAMRVDASPAVIDLALQRHGYRAASVMVSNFDTMDVRVKVYAEELVQDADGVPVDVDPGTVMEYSATEWVQVRPDEFVLRPGQRRNVVVGFQVPEGHTGGRFTRIRIEAEPATPVEGEEGMVLTDLDVSAYLTLGTGHERRLEVVDLVWEQVPGTTELAVGTMVRNSGDIHVTANGRYTLFKYFPATEQEVDGVIIQRDERFEGLEQVMADVSTVPILPGALRYMQGTFQTELEPLTQYLLVAELFQPEGQPAAYRIDLWVDENGIIHPGAMPQPAEGDDPEV